MLLLAAFLAAAPAELAGEMPIIDPNRSASAACPPISRYEAIKRGGKLKPQHLDELPYADLYKAVYRRIDRCEVPIIVKYGIGGR